MILIATAWVVVWGGIWSYSTYRTHSLDRWISAELDVSEKLVVDPAKEQEAINVLEGIESQMDRREKTDLWVERAKWTGPIGLAAILFFGLGGPWVHRGFKQPQQM